MKTNIFTFKVVLPWNETHAKKLEFLLYWIYNVIRAIFFSKFERLFKKNMYISII